MTQEQFVEELKKAANNYCNRTYMGKYTLPDDIVRAYIEGAKFGLDVADTVIQEAETNPALDEVKKLLKE